MMNYKKIAAAVLSVALLPLSAQPMFCKAEKNNYVTVDDWKCVEYILEQRDLDQGAEDIITVEIYGYVGDSEEIVFPDTINDHHVTRVNIDYDFCDHPYSSVVFPKIKKVDYFNTFFKPKDPYQIKSVQFRGDYAPLGNIYLSGTGITELILPTAKVINGPQIIQNCPDLKRVEFSNGDETLNLKMYYFKNCTSLEEVVFGDGYSEIVLGAKFFQNTALKRIEFNSDCKLNQNTFKGCFELKEAKFDKVINAGRWAFSDCTNLENIILASIAK